jgi:glucosamine kinase
MRVRGEATTNAVYSIDAGGSRTTVAVALDNQPTQTWTTESFAIASVGEAAADATLAELLRRIRHLLGDEVTAVGCIASSSMPVAGEAATPSSVIDAVRAGAPNGRVAVVNDVVPLTWSPALAAGGIVVCSGTGSSVLGRDARTGSFVKVGGHEHIVSDQGSAYSLAREGLRAAARDGDGLGPATALRATAEGFFGRSLPSLGRWLAERPRVRTVVAAFAAQVTQCAEDGDAVAGTIAVAEAAALADAAMVAATRLALGFAPPIGLAGGVIHGSPYFRSLLEVELARRDLTDDRRSNLHAVEGIAAGISFARRFVDQPPGEVAGSVFGEGVVVDIDR